MIFGTLAGAVPGIDDMLLVGDIGGTKTVLSAYVHSADGLKSVREEVYPSGAHRSLEEIMRKFLDAGEGESYEAWCFGVAGPVREGKCRVTNLPWVMDEPSLTAACGARRGKLLNDLEAMAYGMLFVPSDKFEVLNPGTECKGVTRRSSPPARDWARRSCVGTARSTTDGLGGGTRRLRAAQRT